MTAKTSERILRLSCLLTILGLILFVWSVLVPTVVPVMVAMSIGQVIGTLAFAGYLYVIVGDLRRAKVLDLDRKKGGEAR